MSVARLLLLKCIHTSGLHDIGNLWLFSWWVLKVRLHGDKANTKMTSLPDGSIGNLFCKFTWVRNFLFLEEPKVKFYHIFISVINTDLLNLDKDL